MSLSLPSKLRSILPICLAVAAIPSVTFADTPNMSFTAPEHIAIGNSIVLYLSSDSSGQKGQPLHLPNGSSFTYGEMVSLGDFYGVLDKAVSQAPNEAQGKQLFMQGFDSLAVSSSSTEEAQHLVAIMHDEEKVLQEGIKNGNAPEVVYKKMGREYDRQYNCETGGGCSPNTWWTQPGRYLNLANTNYDHFGDNAYTTYKIGHQLALEQAVIAHASGDLKKLEFAYAINAFACHFLSDRFASGHIRAPRLELSEKITPATVGSLLSGYMHDEENVEGLHVHNQKGEQWIAYGDKSYFSGRSDKHRTMILAAMQNSADDIYSAFKSGTLPSNDEIAPIIPQPDETGSAGTQDIAPLFYWDIDAQKLMRRSDMTNLKDRHWTSEWWGWSTLLELKRERGLSTSALAMLNKKEVREQALANGVIE
jgi:hypothetical protein